MADAKTKAAVEAIHGALKGASGHAESLLQGLTAAGFSFPPDGKPAPEDAAAFTEQSETIALAFRMALETLLMRNNAAKRDAIADALVVALLDLSVEAAIRGWVPKQLPLMAVHELFEGQTAKQCGVAFEYLEKRVDRLSELTEQGNHKYSQAALLKSAPAHPAPLPNRVPRPLFGPPCADRGGRFSKVLQYVDAAAIQKFGFAALRASAHVPRARAPAGRAVRCERQGRLQRRCFDSYCPSRCFA